MTQKNIENVLHRLVKEAVEEAIQNIGTSSYINSKEVAVTLMGYLQGLAMQMLTIEQSAILERFEEIGYRLFHDYHVPAITWQGIIERVKDDLLYAIHHQIADFDAEELLQRIDLTINGLSKGYLQASVEETLAFVYDRAEAIDVEMDILAYERWYRAFLKSVASDLQDLPELTYEESTLRKWTESLDFKLLMKATSFGNESSILILSHQIYDIAREMVHFIRQRNYRNAYHFVTLLDQKVNMLGDLLKEVLIVFNSEKLRYFFSLFSETILFDKHYSYFLTLSVTTSPFTAHPSDVSRLFLEIYRQAKEGARSENFDFTGVIDDGTATHVLLRYNTLNDVESMLRLLERSIESLQQKEIVLFVPEFIVRAAETEALCGLDPEKLQLLSLKMASVRVDLPMYQLTAKECGELRDDIETSERLNSTILEKLQAGDIDLHFQPIIEATEQGIRLVYCEALVRISHEERVFAAGHFIDAVQRQRLGPLLDRLVFDNLAGMADTIAEVIRGVSANLFVESFEDRTAMESVRRCLESFHDNGLTLTIEITEYNLFEHYQTLEALYQAFPETLKIAVDDFGTGYSSLAALIKLSSKGLLDAVKIDGSLTRNILDDENSFEVVRMAMELSGKLGAKTIVEYVESEALYHKLAEISVNFYAQGYFFGKPVPLGQLREVAVRLEESGVAAAD